MGQVKILIGATKKKFGYNVHNLDIKSNEKIVVECECGEKFCRSYRDKDRPHTCPNYKVINDSDHKRCYSCTNYCPLAHFDLDSSNDSGLNHKCRRCNEDGTQTPIKTGWQCIEDETLVRTEYMLMGKDAVLPTKANYLDAGLDLYSIKDYIIPSGGVLDVHTGVHMPPPPGYYFTVEGRSSMFKKGIFPMRGIIDASYTGPLIVSLNNRSKVDYNVKKHDRIAQFIMHKLICPDFVEVSGFSLPNRERGDNGWGSSGN